MSNTHKNAYRLLLVAEAMTKWEAVAWLGYTLKLVGYTLIVAADSGVSTIQLRRTAVILLIVLAMNYLEINTDNHHNPAIHDTRQHSWFERLPKRNTNLEYSDDH